MKKRELWPMLHRYNVWAGLIFSGSIAVVATVLPKLVRFDTDQILTVLSSFLYIFGAFFFCWMTHHFFMLVRVRPFPPRIRAVVSILCSVLLISLVTRGLVTTGVMPLQRYYRVTVPPEHVLAIRLFRGLVISTLTYFAVYYFRLQVMLRQTGHENEVLQRENLEARLATLIQQISPHFLFNSLNTLSTLSNEEVVKEYILRLSEVYRYVLHYQEQSSVRIRDEIDFIRSYMFILESRFEEGLKMNIRVRPESLNRKVLPFSLQLLVENAVKHNAVSYKNPLSIDVFDLDSKLIVENDLRPRFASHARSGTGLRNLGKRYQLSSGEDIRVSWDAHKFRVEIPFLYDGADHRG